VEAKVAKTHGGRRANAGRKPAAPEYPDPARRIEEVGLTAEEYLSAVVAGLVTATPLKVAAAKCLLAYQKPRARARPPVLPQAELQRRAHASEDLDRLRVFRERAAAIRAAHAAENGEDQDK
jgi:hypothetical protein